MMPFALSFRRLVLKYIPQLKSEDLDRHESLIALRHQLIQEKNIKPPQTHLPILDENIEKAAREANAILAPYKKEFEAVLRLWLARRQLALKQGGLLQIPTTWEGFVGFFGALGNYLWVQVTTFPTLTRNRIKNLSLGHWVAIAVLVILLCLGAISLKKGDQIGKIPKQPENGALIQDSTAIRK
jgi:hypothetical protein